MGVVGGDSLEKAVAFFGCQGGRLALQRVEHHAERQLVVVVVGEAQRGVSEAETVHLVNVAQPPHLGHIAVGHEIKGQALALGQGCGRLLRLQ